MEKMTALKLQLTQLRLNYIKQDAEQIIHQAGVEQLSLIDYSIRLLEKEITCRRNKSIETKLKRAKLPTAHDLDHFDFTHQNGITKDQLDQLRELLWLDQHYNLLLMGPSGTGKSFLAAGMVYDAICKGYSALFRTAQQLIDVLKLKDITRSAIADYKRICSCHLLVIDDLMMMPMDQQLANQLFHLINHLHNKASVIVTTNKSPQQWTEVLKDEVLATAILDRLLYRCQLLKLTGESYRMKHRSPIFSNQNPSPSAKGDGILN